jgi:hypothetical protein
MAVQPNAGEYYVYTYNVEYTNEFLEGVPADANFAPVIRSPNELVDLTQEEKSVLRNQIFSEIREGDDYYQILFISNSRFFGEGITKILTISKDNSPLIKFRRPYPRDEAGNVIQKGRLLQYGESRETDILLDIIQLGPQELQRRVANIENRGTKRRRKVIQRTKRRNHRSRKVTYYN